MKCPYCGYETNSETIFYMHVNGCLATQEENGLTGGGSDEKNYEKMNWQQLKKHAAQKGIDITAKKKGEILQELADMEGNPNDNNNAAEGKDNPPYNG